MLPGVTIPLWCARRSPPCIRHRPFFIAGDWHGLPTTPRILDVADDGLPALVDVDVLNRDLLLALSAVAVEAFDQRLTSLTVSR